MKARLSFAPPHEPEAAFREPLGWLIDHDQHLNVPTDQGANAGVKVPSLVAGMVAGADGIDDMAVLRHGGMGRVCDRAYAPSTLGSFLRRSCSARSARRRRLPRTPTPGHRHAL